MKNPARQNRLIRRIKKFLHDEGANVAIIVGFSIFVLVAFAGSGVDLARSQIIQQKMHQAADAAALAAAIPPQGTAEAERTAIMNRYFMLNFPDNFMGSGVTVDDLLIAYEPDGDNPQTVNVQLAADVQTDFVKFVGRETVGISSETEVAVPANQPRDMDVVMIADTTTSMRGPRIDGLIQASYTFAEILLHPDNKDPEDEIRISVIEYSASPGPCGNNGPRDLGIKNNSPYSEDLAYVNAQIGLFDAEGCTDGGHAAGVGADSLIAARQSNGRAAPIRAYIFMTDGEFNTPSQGQSQGSFNAACARLRAQQDEIDVYTVKYGNAGNAQMLRNCASSPENYFEAPNPEDLEDVFRGIALGLRQVRITK